MADTGLFGTPQEHIDDAAAAGLYAAQYLPRASEQEYMTLLIEGPDGKIRREAFQTLGDKRKSSWTGRPQGKIVGIVHNHPTPGTGDRYPSTRFSDTDVNTAIKVGAPSYVSAALSGRNSLPAHVKYDPKGQHRDTSQPGQAFLAQFPIEEMKKRIALRIQNDPKMYPEMKRRLLQSLIVPPQQTSSMWAPNNMLR